MKNTYKCTECGSTCTNNKSSDKNPAVTLGTWNCPTCKGKVSVKVVRVKE